MSNNVFDLIAVYRHAAEQIKEFTRVKDGISAEIKALMEDEFLVNGHAQIADSDGVVVAEMKRVTTNRLDTKALKAYDSELYKQFSKESHTTRLTVK